MRLLYTFVRKYPMQSTVMLIALLFAGLAEGVGLSALFPLLATVVNKNSKTGGISGDSSSPENTSIEQVVNEILQFLGLEPSIMTLLVIIVASITLKSGFVLLAKRQVGYTVADVATDLRLEMLRSLLATRWNYYLLQPIGSLANAIATEANRASKAYHYGATLAAYTFEGLIIVAVALMVSWKATLTAIAASLVILYLLNQLVKKAKRAGVRQTRLLQSLLSRLTDSLLSVKPLKAMAREESAAAFLRKETTRLNKALRKQVFSKEALKALQEPLIFGFLAVGLYVAMIYVELSFTTVTILVFLLARLMKHLGKIQQQYQNMLISESAYWSLAEKIDEARRESEPLLGDQKPQLNNAIRLENVSLSYDGQPVLTNASLLFPKGSFTMLVGASGAGKTTVADLIIGLLRPQDGEIWIDEQPLADVDLKSWRHMIGYVPQETLLLHDSILNNVTLGDPDLTPDSVRDALHAAGALNFVEAMPQGMYSIVGERGGKLSGGQRQRIAIARAVVHQPLLLILDEATSALDPDSESTIGRTLQKLRGKLTIIAISHQPTLIKSADRAYCIENGKAILMDSTTGNSVQANTANSESTSFISSGKVYSKVKK